MELEVPVAPGDQRAWDSVITRFADDPTARLPAEFDSVVADFQAQVRRITLKAGDAGIDCVLWVSREHAAIERRFVRHEQSSPAPFQSARERHCGRCARADIPAGRA